MRVQEAANQFAVMVGWKQRRYGLDGYTSFVPPDSAYDPARRDALFRQWPVANDPAPADVELTFPTLPMLAAMVQSIPPATRAILFFPPLSVEIQGMPGSIAASRWAACKREVAGTRATTRGSGAGFRQRDQDHDEPEQFWDRSTTGRRSRAGSWRA